MNQNYLEFLNHKCAVIKQANNTKTAATALVKSNKLSRMLAYFRAGAGKAKAKSKAGLDWVTNKEGFRHYKSPLFHFDLKNSPFSHRHPYLTAAGRIGGAGAAAGAGAYGTSQLLESAGPTGIDTVVPIGAVKMPSADTLTDIGYTAAGAGAGGLLGYGLTGSGIGAAAGAGLGAAAAYGFANPQTVKDAIVGLKSMIG